jgi:ectoine hydroxylase-related dioxygenase (phytanoyl-CoA dioxygenase family)
MSANTYLSQLNEPYFLTPEQVHFYQENKFIKLKQVLSPEVLQYFDTAITQKVEALNTMHLPMEQRDTYSKAFLQIMNLWTKSEVVKQLIFSKRLAKIATELMQVSGVRLYHDQALYKEPSGGFTPWHADQYYWPLHNDNTVTAWIPLQVTPLEMGPLQFSVKSHTLTNGRALKISDDSEEKIGKALRINDFEQVNEPFDLGEVSFHSGWIFHRAGPNQSQQMRKVMTIIYMDKDMRLKTPENENQQLDWETWCPGAKIGEVINTALNPVLYVGED